jgi:hypothetical protein
MPITNSILCTDGTIIKLDYGGNSITPGQFWSAWDNLAEPGITIRNCVVAGDEEAIGATLTAVTQYNSCYECFTDNFTTVRLTPCDENLGLPDTVDIDIAQFGFIPIDQQIFYLEFTSTGRTTSGTWIGCYRVEGFTQNSETDYYLLELSTIDQIIHSNFSLENGCNECLNGFSAGTEYTSCIICCPCGTGSTVTESIVPHPVATNLFGQSVVQLNAVQLGGSNGLYA